VAITRRTLLLGAAAAAAGGAGAVELLGRSAGSRPLPVLERGVALGPFFSGRADQRYESNRARFAETGTRWVRMWADWPRVEPVRGLFAPQVVDALDRQVDAARADGMKVMLTAWRFAPWVPGPAGSGDPTFRVPFDLGEGSDWAGWIAWLLERYGSRIDALELMNEPNLQMWPQTGIDGATATMMETGAAVARRTAEAPLIVAPATADVDAEPGKRTSYADFTRAVLDRLAERGFAPGPRFAWSHHNYTDVERDLGGASNRVGQVRGMLAGRWTGWPHGNGHSPGVLVTESGARPAVVARNFGITDPGLPLVAQAEAIRRNLWRMTVGPEGAGVGLVCQYLFVTDRFYDSGLCEFDGTRRPAYFAWAAAPG
jgi:hypothetical protein